MRVPGSGLLLAVSGGKPSHRMSMRARIQKLVCSCAGIIALGTGPAPAAEVDNGSLKGKVICGYQGWFSCAGDGARVGWTHWSKQRWEGVKPGLVQFDLWPDMAEYSAEERFATGFKLADGSPAELFSSDNVKTVRRHFGWMREYGIDGALVQRFPVDFPDAVWSRRVDRVLAHCREAAIAEKRVYGVMYDLSGLRGDRFATIIRDWGALRKRLQIGEDRAYLHHQGRPLVGIWGVGFNDRRDYSLVDCRRLIEKLRGDGCAILLGVPTWWREGRHDAIEDPELREVIKLADVISPWSVGRYRDPAEARRHGEKVWRLDLDWCRREGSEYLPVVFPGFSWRHLRGGPLGAIPRRRGRFLWAQFSAAKRSGAEMVYVAMFDEVDEGTAIFKCANHPPTTGDTRFLTYEGLPSDFYLRLAGEGGKLLRGEIDAVEFPPGLPGDGE